MNHHLTFILSIFLNIALCSDFYIGMFKKNDILVAQDRVYKQKVPYRMTYAKYGRYFKCPITYFRVVDRLGRGRGPRVEIIRGGIGKRYMVLRLTSSYNLPISVNVYVGCENKLTTTTKQAHTDTTTLITATTRTDDGNEVNTTEMATSTTIADGGGGNSAEEKNNNSSDGGEGGNSAEVKNNNSADSGSGGNSAEVKNNKSSDGGGGDENSAEGKKENSTDGGGEEQTTEVNE